MSHGVEKSDYIFKVLLVGDSGVGKSCLLTRFTAQIYDEGHCASTVGVDYHTKFFTSNDERIKFEMWDTAGQERFRGLTRSYYRAAHGIIYVYDVSRRQTFENIESVWMAEVETHNDVKDAAKIIVANKVDLDHNREVTTEEGREFAIQHGCLYIETSAKRDISVSSIFHELLKKIKATPSLLNSKHCAIHLGANRNKRKNHGFCC